LSNPAAYTVTHSLGLELEPETCTMSPAISEGKAGAKSDSQGGGVEYAWPEPSIALIAPKASKNCGTPQYTHNFSVTAYFLFSMKLKLKFSAI